MNIPVTVMACFLMLISVFAQTKQTTQEEVLQAARNWLRDISKGDRTGLNAFMDARFIATTPAGDVLTKERLVPDDLSQSVQKLPAMDLIGPIVRVYGDTAIVMGRLQSTVDVSQVMDGTFIYIKRENAWKLAALHLSTRK